MWRPGRTADGEETRYGIGWRVGTDEEGRRVVGHTGGSIGGTTRLWVYPEEGVAVAVVSNLSDAPLDGLTRRVAALFIEAGPPPHP